MRKHAHCLAHCESGEGHPQRPPPAPATHIFVLEWAFAAWSSLGTESSVIQPQGEILLLVAGCFPLWEADQFSYSFSDFLSTYLFLLPRYYYTDFSLYIWNLLFWALTFTLLEGRVWFVLFWLLVILHIIGFNKFFLLMISDFLLKVTFDCVNSIIEPYRMALVFLTYKIAVPYPSHQFPKPWPQAPFLVTYLINCDI